MSLTRASLRRPITVIVAVIALILGAATAIVQMPRDILPNLGTPVIYVAQPYSGMTPAQMESFLTYYYEFHFLYITGIEHVESKSIQGVALIKLQFHTGTDMAQAMAETVGYVDRARAFMPPGTVPPFVMRFDAGSVPIGDLVFASPSRSLGELQDLALNRVRPLFAALPGVSAPPPFGASQRTIVIRLDPEKLRRYHLSPDNAAQAVAQADVITPAGNIYLGNLYPMVRLNSVVADIHKLEGVPIRPGTSPTVFLRDIGTVEDATDIPTGFALVNGRKTVYIPVTKRADASTLSVAALVRQNLPRFQSVLPGDVTVSYEFDQSAYVRDAIFSLVFEGLLGALLTGLMILLFLRDWRSALAVVLNIPLAICGATFALWLCRQTINLMTLGGLALAVGILVDESTVVIENIRVHLDRGSELARASLDATQETIVPRLLAMLAISAVFLPSFFMKGAPRALFVPLSLAVAFAMIFSYLLSSALVPILGVWLLRRSDPKDPERPCFDRFRKSYVKAIGRIGHHPAWTLLGYAAATTAALAACVLLIGTEIFPRGGGAPRFEMRLRAPTGTRIEQTERLAAHALKIIRKEAGPGAVEMSLGYVGVQPGSYPINTIYLWTSGPQDAVLDIGLAPHAHVNIETLEERLRKRLALKLPNVRVSFTPADIVSRVMSQGATTPIQIVVSGPSFTDDRRFGRLLLRALAKIPILRDVQIEQPLNYPTVAVRINREKAGVMGLTAQDVGRSLAEATSSSRYILPVYWSDSKSGIAYQMQVEIPQNKMTSLNDVKRIPVRLNNGAVSLDRFSQVFSTSAVGEYDRYNMQRMVTIAANVAGTSDLGSAARNVERLLRSLQVQKPGDVTVSVRGEVAPMREMFDGLRIGLALAVLIIFLLLAAYFQSFRLPLAALSTTPAVLAGSGLMMLATGTTLNVESFMGSIMALGIAMANAILLIAFAERRRQEGLSAVDAVADAAANRLRPILMTSSAMLAGMAPLSLGLSQSGGQSAPLGRAVFGGLFAATLATLFILPTIYALLERGRRLGSPSLDPDDPAAGYRA
ncbi:MAG: efflux RND transporter permease subunit [Elusimicrobiota bacterium]